MARHVSISVLAAFVVAVSAVPAFAIDIAQIRNIVGSGNGNDFPGCAFGIYENGKTVLTGGMGGADVAVGRGIDADTQFYAASDSKQFTAMAIAQLVVAGKVGMDDDIRKYIPEFAYEHPVTVAMLMHHTSGVPDFFSLIRLTRATEFAGSVSTVSREEALKLVLGMKNGNFEPGTRFSYSNGGYLLLSEIVERVSKMPFHEYVARNIFEKLGMKRSFVLHGRFSSDPNVAHGYVVKDGKPFLADTYPLFGGSGGIEFTVNDIAKYARDINVEHKLWTLEVTKILLEPGRFSDGTLVEGMPGMIYAGGVFLGDGWISHGGGAEGFANFLAWFPARKIGIAFLCNNGSVGIYKDITGKVQQIADALSGLPSLAKPYPGLPSPDGRFASRDLPIFYDVKQIDKTLTIDIVARDSGTNGKGFTLSQQGDGSFQSQDGMHVTFDHARNTFELDDDALAMSFERVRP